MKLPITVLIYTFNEEKNIKRCLENVTDICEEIVIVDSFSTDKTVDIAKNFTPKIYKNHFESHSRQLQWALDNTNITTEWILKIDADEVLADSLKKELIENLNNTSKEINAFYINRRLYFLGRWIRFGANYPAWAMRLWRNGKITIENRWLDDHVTLKSGKYSFLQNDMSDFDMKDITRWTTKHNNNASKEAIDLLNFKYKLYESTSLKTNFLGTQVQKKRWIKDNLYCYTPLFLRSFIYFIWRYFFMLGFLDGKEGLIWHFLQGFWFRFLADVKVFEVEKKAKLENKSIKDDYVPDCLLNFNPLVQSLDTFYTGEGGEGILGFYMFRYKTSWCPNKKDSHDSKSCIYAHHTRDFRRPPDIFKY